MKSATGHATQTDAGTLVTLQWPAPATPNELPREYFEQAEINAHGVPVNRFAVTSASQAEAEFSAVGGLTFTVSFAEPDRLGLGGCTGRHGGMNDTVGLQVDVGAPGDAGARVVSTSADIYLGAY